MKFTHLFSDDRAVSPVIGVILMVAITVIPAAVIGTFVLGLGGSSAWADADGEVTAGDSTTVRITAPDTVDVVWVSPTGDNSATLASEQFD